MGKGWKPGLTVSRQLLGPVGLIVGFLLYGLAGRLAPPLDAWLIGAMFVALGLSALRYGRGERWIQGLGVALLVYGLARAFLLGGQG